MIASELKRQVAAGKIQEVWPVAIGRSGRVNWTTPGGTYNSRL